MGQTVTATAAGLDQNDNTIATGTTTWTSSSTAVAEIDGTGVITGMTSGTSRIIATSGDKTGEQVITVTAPAAIIFNEVESNGGTPGDWVEMYNPTTATVDISGWVFKDNDDSHAYTFPAGTTIAAGAYFVTEEATFGFGLGGAESVRLYNKFGVLVASYTWTTHAVTTYGRCPNIVGEFATTAASTKGTANTCGPIGPTTSAWPGIGTDVQTVDALNAFVENLSGLTYEGSGAGAVLWAVKNGPGTLYRLIWNGTIWTMDNANNWSAGKALRYPGGIGNPDTEGVTFAGSGSANGIYVSTERNNDSSTVSRNRILRFDPQQTGATLTALNEWDITSDLPAVGANLGIEAITWVPDTYLVGKGFYDEKAGHAYVPSEYPNHGDGLFFVGVEANGIVYAYALNHVTNGFTRIATITTTFPGVMALEFDRDVGYLWATCDDGCGNKSAILEINTMAGSPTLGRFSATRFFNRPSSLPDKNNEGFAIAPESECVAGKKFVFWSDDGNTDGHAIRRGTISCGVIP